MVLGLDLFFFLFFGLGLVWFRFGYGSVWRGIAGVVYLWLVSFRRSPVLVLLLCLSPGGGLAQLVNLTGSCLAGCGW